jgi:outer membrane protein assembly factor BamB
MKRYARVVLTLTLAGLAAGPPASGEWAAWRGPNDNGRVTEPSWDPQAMAGKLRVAWRAEVGRGHSAVAVRGDRLYTMGQKVRGSGSGRVAEEVIYCLSAKTGREIWRYGYPTTERDWPGPASTPVLDGDRLYTIGRQGEMLCLDANTGAVIWKRDLAREHLAEVPDWGFCSSPVVAGELVLLNAGSAGLTLDKNTGQVVWSSGKEAGSLSTPLVIGSAGQRRALVASASTLSAVDVATGKIRWSRGWQASSDPVLLGDRVLLTGGGRRTASALLRIAGAEPEPLWEGEHLGGGFQSVVVIDGYAYGFGRGGRSQELECVEVATGQRKWNQNLGEWGSLIAVNQSLLIAEGDGDFVLAAASPEGFREIARINAIPMTPAETNANNNDMRAVWTAPAFDAGRVFVRDNFGALVCITGRS